MWKMCISSHISQVEDRSQQEREEVISPDRLRGVQSAQELDGGQSGAQGSASMVGARVRLSQQKRWLGPNQAPRTKSSGHLSRYRNPKQTWQGPCCRNQWETWDSVGPKALYLITHKLLPSHIWTPLGRGEHLNSSCIFHTLSHPSKWKMQSQKFSLHHQAIWHYSSPLRFCIAGV